MPGGPALILCTVLLLAACSQAGHVPVAEIPDGAIEVREGYYMVPAGTDDEGCRMYRAYAPGMMTDQAIRFQRQDGSFTMNKEEAACDGRS